MSLLEKPIDHPPLTSKIPETRDSDSDSEDLFEIHTEEDGTVWLPVYEEDTLTRVQYVPRMVVDMEQTVLKDHIKRAESVIEDLRRQLRNFEEPPDYETPCAICLLRVDAKSSKTSSGCCNRLVHTRCILRTSFRVEHSFPTDKCIHCLHDESKHMMEHMRTKLIAQEEEKNRNSVPTPDAMLKLCNACGRLEHLAVFLDRRYRWSQAEVDTIYEEYRSITMEEILSRQIRLSSIIDMGLTLSQFVHQFHPTQKQFFPSDKSPNLDINRTDFQRSSGHMSALVEVGVDEKYLRVRAGEKEALNLLTKFELTPTDLCILGFTALTFILMGMQKDVVPKFPRFTLEDWIELLGLDKTVLSLLFIKDSDFGRGRTLERWNMNALSRRLKLRAGEVEYLIRRDERTREGKHPKKETPGQRYDLRIVSSPQPRKERVLME